MPGPIFMGIKKLGNSIEKTGRAAVGARVQLTKDRKWNAELMRLGRFEDEMRPVIFNELDDTGVRIRNNIIRLMERTPPGKPAKVPGTSVWYNQSRPGKAPAIATSNLKNSIKMDTREAQMEVEVGSTIRDPNYPLFLEEGTKRMRPRPFLKHARDIATKNIQKRIIRALNRIR